MDRGDKFCQKRGFWSVKIQLFQILTYDTSLEAQFYADQTLRKNLGLKINRNGVMITFEPSRIPYLVIYKSSHCNKLGNICYERITL